MSLPPNERSRSPRFPSYSIRDAIVYAERIYQGVHRSSIDTHTAYRLMGFAGKSGASATALGAIRQYGLVEGVGSGTRISQLGLRILEPASSQERNEAIVEAARKPDAFKAVLGRFDNKLPSADEPVRAFLIRDLGFSKTGADDCLKSLRETLEMLEDSSISLASGVENRAGFSISESETREAVPREFMRVPLTKDCSVDLRFIGTVSEKALSNLIRHIELTREVWSAE